MSLLTPTTCGVDIGFEGIETLIEESNQHKHMELSVI